MGMLCAVLCCAVLVPATVAMSHGLYVPPAAVMSCLMSLSRVAMAVSSGCVMEQAAPCLHRLRQIQKGQIGLSAAAFCQSAKLFLMSKLQHHLRRRPHRLNKQMSQLCLILYLQQILVSYLM